MEEVDDFVDEALRAIQKLEEPDLQDKLQDIEGLTRVKTLVADLVKKQEPLRKICHHARKHLGASSPGPEPLPQPDPKPLLSPQWRQQKPELQLQLHHLFTPPRGLSVVPPSLSPGPRSFFSVSLSLPLSHSLSLSFSRTSRYYCG